MRKKVSGNPTPQAFSLGPENVVILKASKLVSPVSSKVSNTYE